MAGTKIGGAKAAATNKARHGADYYAVLGRRGGKNGCYANNPYYTGGFAGNRELAREAGRRGGAISRRGPARPRAHKIEVIYD